MRSKESAMGRIVVSENVSLDGVIQDPRGEEGLGRGDWFAWLGETDVREWGEVLLAEAVGAEGLLLGRRSFDYFAARFPSRSGAWAERLNSMPKYVVSSTPCGSSPAASVTAWPSSPTSPSEAPEPSLPGHLTG
jgi:dihydrofolate reductase